MNHHSKPVIILTMLAFLALALAGATAARLVPARANLFFPVDNPCAKAGLYCNGVLTCPRSPHGTCEGPQSCAPASYPLGNGSTLKYCACAVGGPTVDPRNQPTWECTAVAKIDPGGNPVGMDCFNGVECQQGEACTKITDVNTGCESCECK